MAQLQLNPYIFFRGNAREAMEFYRDIFGGELNLQSYKDTGQGNMGMPDDNIMHASLDSDTIHIFGSDTAQASEKAAKVSLSLMGDDEANLRRIFEGLSEGGEVFQALEKMFWGDTFGSLTDKYGVEWMVNIEGPKPA